MSGKTYGYRIVTVHDKPVGDGADWMHGKDRRWYRAETPERYATLGEAQEALWASGLEERSRARIIAWPDDDDEEG